MRSHQVRGYVVFPVVLLACALVNACAPYRSRAVVMVPPSVLHEAPSKPAQAMWQQAEQQLAGGRLNEAVITYEQLAQAYPANAIACRALNRLGKIYLDQGQPGKALRYYDYLLSTYPQWDDADNVHVDQMRALWADGNKKLVLRQAPAIHQRLFKPDAKLALSLFIANCYREKGEVEAALDWLAAGYPSARTLDERNALNRATKEAIEGADAKTVQRLLSQSPSEYLRVFLEFRLAQLELAGGQANESRNRLLRLQSEAKNHPLVPEIKAALQGVPVAKAPSPGAQVRPGGEAPLPAPPAAQPPPPVTAPVDTTIPFNPNRIGCLVPINGQYAAYGRQVVHGVTMAAEEYNQRHPDQPITIVTKDTKDDAETTLQSYRELTRDQGVLGIIGPLSGLCLQAIAAPAEQMGVPLLSLTQPDEETAANPYVIHVFLDNRQMLKSLVQYCRSKLNFKSFAVLYPNDRYGQRLSKTFDEEVQAAGGSVVANIPYTSDSTDFQEPIQKLLKTAAQSASPSDSISKGLPFEALFIPDQARTVSLLAPQLPHHNVVGVQLLGSNLWANPELTTMGGLYVEQAIFPAAYYPGNPDPKVQRFEEQFKQLYQGSPSYLEAQAYDALKMLLYAMDHTRGPLQRSTVVDTLRQISRFDGITGTITFAGSAQPQRRYPILQVVNGQIVPVPK
jgi:branched-chain amino acid transport system substrate-binding protein